MASWDDDLESDSRDDIDIANVMAHRDDPTKITLEASLHDSDLTMDEFA